MELTDFLLARFAEDQAVAQAATPGPWATQTMAGNLVYGDPEAGVFVCDTGIGVEQVLDDAEHIARHDPAHVLAECDAKRRIVTDYVETSEALECLPTELAFSSTLRLLALPYADHPDYREAWRP